MRKLKGIRRFMGLLLLSVAVLLAASAVATATTAPAAAQASPAVERVLPAVTITATVPLQHEVDYGDAIIKANIGGDFSVYSVNTIQWFYVLPASGTRVDYEAVTATTHGITGGVDGDITGAYWDMLGQRDLWVWRQTSQRPEMVQATEHLDAGWTISAPAG